KARNGVGLAERVGFEPTVRLPVRRISSAVQSTTLPPLRRRIYRKVRARTRVDGLDPSLARSLALLYCDPARPALRTIAPQRTISAATKPLSSSGGGDWTGRRPRLLSSRRTS